MSCDAGNQQWRQAKTATIMQRKQGVAATRDAVESELEAGEIEASAVREGE